MWRRAYLFLALVRLYFALSPSYLHPDENFQGPEVIAGAFVCFERTWSISIYIFRLQMRPRIAFGAFGNGATSTTTLFTYQIQSSFANSLSPHRPNIQLSRPINLGIYLRRSRSKRLSIVACLRPADAPPSMAVDREWK